MIERTTQGLLRRGHVVDLVVPKFGEPGRAEPFPLRRAGLPPFGRPVESRFTLSRLVDDAFILLECLRQRPDVIVGHNVDGGMIAGLVGRAMSIPTVYVRHSTFAREISIFTHGSRLASSAAHLAERWVENAAGTVIELAPSASGGDFWLPPPADLFEQTVEPGGGDTLYYEGNLDRVQNPGWLDAALCAAREVQPRARLVVARSPKERPDRADLALLPRSLPGGFPMKLLAYQLAGIPTVCVEEAVPGLIHGEDAFIVRGAGSAPLFAASVREALADPEARRRVRTRARARAIRVHHPDRVAERLEWILERASVAPPRTRPYIR
ncbi:MAG: glycosyltransferase [Myxococcota bacterium]